MKFPVLLLTTGIAGILLSCQKDQQGEPELLVSATDVKFGELVTAKVVNARPGTTIDWHSRCYQVFDSLTDGTKAKMFFVWNEKDSIKVTLYQNGQPYASFTKYLKIIQEPFQLDNTIPGHSAGSLNGKRLSIHPFISYFDSTLAFLVNTSDSYDCLNSYILTDAETFCKKIDVSFSEVWVRGDCEKGTLQASRILYTHTYYSDGLYPINIKVGSKTYTGSLKVTGFATKYEFLWPHDEVSISPTNI
ncbi:hypothetical protein [Paraflavitalea sp. CAU 1676]|uniref:hypothetical protein n=1 Tax=Paraflavitalea sp. CAU 1676 TaxID=3032598 RepID=UPI0023DBA0DE|nr:hypothetical protein [Paraflavitalea sp. CAU 1676]MDF2187183.1 hypothetical protein [Paraflavitalea sp. CAU 1676]